MKKNFNIMSDDLTISKLSYSDSVWSLEKGNIINTQKNVHLDLFSSNETSFVY